MAPLTPSVGAEVRASRYQTPRVKDVRRRSQRVDHNQVAHLAMGADASLAAGKAQCVSRELLPDSDSDRFRSERNVIFPRLALALGRRAPVERLLAALEPVPVLRT